MLCCMSTRTQVYLTQEQRTMIDRLAADREVTLAEIVRRALDRYLAEESVDSVGALQATFGADPLAAMPDRDQWSRG